VRLGDGLSTGIFLDQRANRRRVREMSAGLNVLNLFAYTCPFTVAAAAGGARSTTSVDVSAGALAWGAENLAENGLAGAAHRFATADVFGWLEGARARRDRFDLVILDPPSYSTTKDGSRFSSASDYRDLAALVLPLLAPGGRLLACSNHRGIVRAKLRRYLHEAARAAGCAVAQMRDLSDPTDFPPPPGHEVHLKSVLVTVGSTR
jgi:23S rRNA (cytosine1962-C5)-methyltransferase